jgi:hypothetical protein
VLARGRSASGPSLSAPAFRAHPWARLHRAVRSLSPCKLRRRRLSSNRRSRGDAVGPPSPPSCRSCAGPSALEARRSTPGPATTVAIAASRSALCQDRSEAVRQRAVLARARDDVAGGVPHVATLAAPGCTSEKRTSNACSGAAAGRSDGSLAARAARRGSGRDPTAVWRRNRPVTADWGHDCPLSWASLGRSDRDTPN